jgi:hypothetical protein
VVTFTNSPGDKTAFDRASVYKDELLAPVLPTHTGLTDKTIDPDFIGRSVFHLEQALQELDAVKVANAVPERCGTWQLEQRAIVAHEGEADVGMTDRLQMNLVFDVSTFGVL